MRKNNLRIVELLRHIPLNEWVSRTDLALKVEANHNAVTSDLELLSQLKLVKLAVSPSGRTILVQKNNLEVNSI